MAVEIDREIFSLLFKSRIGVLGGGVSEERDISLISANEVYKVLKNKGYDVVFVDIKTDNKDQIKCLLSSLNIKVAFIALHGRFGEDGGIQKILESLNIIYTGSGAEACYRTMDKIKTKEIFIQRGIPTPDFIVVDKNNLSLLKTESLNYPLMVKPFFSGSSLGVSRLENREGLSLAIEKAFSYSQRVILEKYIEGREFSVGIFAEKPLGVVEVVPSDGFYDFSHKYTPGKTKFIAPANLESEIYSTLQREALAAHSSLGCQGFSRVDMILDKNNNVFVLEVNALPGLTSKSLLPLSAKVAGINFDDLILGMIYLKLAPLALKC